jgi:UDP-N-acetyl-D-glucosamine dehydrogenase
VDRLVVVGQGYVGLPVALRACEQGFDVVGFDIDDARIKKLAAGESTVEDVTDDRLVAALATGRYRATTDPDDCADFDAAIVSVPTPLTEGVPDLSYIEAAAATLGANLRPGACVVLESTTYPGTTEELLGSALEEASGLTAGTDFHLGYSPERIDPGNADWPFEAIPKVISGMTPACLDAVDDIYSRLVDTTVRVSSPRIAELTKLLENTYRHVNIALINELAIFAHDLGIDIWEAVDAASTKPFGYLRFTPGPGVGGHCLPIDPSYLSWHVRRSLGHNFRFVELANDVNEHMPEYVVNRLMVALNERGLAVRDRRILVLGLAFKRNTGDDRESPAQGVTRGLLDLGAEVRAADPHVAEESVDSRVTRVDCTAEELEAADAVVLLVDHDVFDPDLITTHARFVFDTRRFLTGERVEHL